MSQNKKQVWFNINTGEFSNSWNPEFVHENIKFSQTELKEITERGWKLIEYICVNDEKFEFYNRMKIVSNTKNEKLGKKDNS